MKLLLGTTNKGKLIEVQAALQGLPLEILSPREFKIQEDPVEVGTTFVENAEQKARFYFERGHLPTLADDSGILVETLKEELGLHTRRWGAGKDATDAEWIAHFLERMKNEENRRARFVCVLAFVAAEGHVSFFEGHCEGTITETLEAEYLPGLPLSACFKPEGSEKVFSALSLEEKEKYSHRGRALALFREFLSVAIKEADTLQP